MKDSLAHTRLSSAPREDLKCSVLYTQEEHSCVVTLAVDSVRAVVKMEHCEYCPDSSLGSQSSASFVCSASCRAKVSFFISGNAHLLGKNGIDVSVRFTKSSNYFFKY